MAGQTALFISEEYLPRQLEIKDPRNMHKSVLVDFFDHVCQRQQIHGPEKAFRFKAVKTKDGGMGRTQSPDESLNTTTQRRGSSRRRRNADAVVPVGRGPAGRPAEAVSAITNPNGIDNNNESTQAKSKSRGNPKRTQAKRSTQKQKSKEPSGNALQTTQPAEAPSPLPTRPKPRPIFKKKQGPPPLVSASASAAASDQEVIPSHSAMPVIDTSLQLPSHIIQPVISPPPPAIPSFSQANVIPSTNPALAADESAGAAPSAALSTAATQAPTPAPTPVPTPRPTPRPTPPPGQSAFPPATRLMLATAPVLDPSGSASVMIPENATRITKKASQRRPRMTADDLAQQEAAQACDGQRSRPRKVHFRP